MVLSIEEAVLENMSNLSNPIEELSREYGSTEVAVITVDQIIKRGLRRVPTLVTNVSSVDSITGQKLRDIPIREFSASGSMVQAFWYGMTGKSGSAEEIKQLAVELESDSEISHQIIRFIQNTIRDHPEVKPMAILSATFAMVPEDKSYFHKCKIEGKKGSELVRAAVLDSKKIFAQSVGIVGIIYSLKYGDKKIRKPFFDGTKSWGENLAHTMGIPPEYALHLEKIGIVHVAQGKGNVSSHASHLVGSMGANPYQCISTCVTALSAPGHAKASTDAMKLIDAIILDHGKYPASDQVETFLTNWLKQGKKIPGVGQAVMKGLDPRFIELYELSTKTSKIMIVEKIRSVIPQALENSGVVLNSPNPNVNLILGSFAESLGIYEKDFFPVLFTVGRIMDPLSQFVENTIWNSNMLRPESLTTEELLTLARNARIKSSPSGMVRDTISKFKSRGEELYESLIVNLLNNLPENQIDIYGRAIIDRLSLFKENGGREFYRVDIRSRAALSANAAITYSDHDGNIYLGLAKKWHNSSDHEKGIVDSYQNIGGYMNTIISRAIKRILSSEISNEKEQIILRGSSASSAYSKEFWENMTPEKFASHIQDKDLVECLCREIHEETGLSISTKTKPKLVSSVVKHRSKNDLSLLINYYSVHMGVLDSAPKITPGDDVAIIDFINTKDITKVFDSSNSPTFYVQNSDGTKTLIDKNNAIEYERAVDVSRNTDFKERFGFGIKEFIALTVSLGRVDLLKSAPKVNEVFGEETNMHYKYFIVLAEKISKEYIHTIKTIQEKTNKYQFQSKL